MKDLKLFRKEWSREQKRLRTLLKTGKSLEESREIFYMQHAVLHRRVMSGMDRWSYAGEIFSDLIDKEYRQIPDGEEHSLIWILWHISRIEDITMNILVQDTEQIYHQEDWKEILGSPIHYTGNQIRPDDLLKLTSSIDPQKLQDYRDAVGRKTRDVVEEISSDRLSQNVSPQGLERIVNEGAVLPESRELLAYWGKRKVYQLLLMPPTRHLMVHLNEAMNLKEIIRKA